MKRVLLVEDHNVFREALATYLGQQTDIEVVAQAGSLSEVGGIHLDGIDVALVKASLPDGDGADLVREMSEGNPRASALVLTTGLDPDTRSRALEAGASEMLTTAATLEGIADAIRGFVGR